MQWLLESTSILLSFLWFHLHFIFEAAFGVCKAIHPAIGTFRKNCVKVEQGHHLWLRQVYDGKEDQEAQMQIARSTAITRDQGISLGGDLGGATEDVRRLTFAVDDEEVGGWRGGVQTIPAMQQPFSLAAHGPPPSSSVPVP